MSKFLRAVLLVSLTLLVILPASQSPAAAQGGDPNLPPTFMVPEVISERPHDPSAYTQGLLYYDGYLYESAGEYGESTLRKVDPETGEVVRQISVPAEYFAEGLERIGDHLIQLTWKEDSAFVYDINTFELLDTITYQGEGWGLCADDRFLFMSDGSSFITLRDRDTFDFLFDGMVSIQNQPVTRINELECVGDYIYANIYLTNYILKINKYNGVVEAIIDASGLLTDEEQAQLASDEVLNGIVYLPDSDTFLITGKHWPKMFEVRFVESTPPSGQ